MTASELSAGSCHNAVRNSDQPSYPCGMCPACIAADWSPQNIPLPIALRPITLTLEAAEQMRRLIDSNEPGAVGKEMPELSHLPAPLTASELSALTVRCPELAAEVQRLQKLNEDLCEKYAAQSSAMTRSAEIHAEKERENNRLTALLTTCCSCGQQCNTSADLRQHCEVCDRHLVSRLRRENAELTARSDRLRAVLAQAMEHLPHGGYVWSKVREVLG